MTGYERKTKKGKYWSISLTGEVYPNYEYDDSTDNALYDNANYYSDETLAKNNERADKLMRQLRRFATANNDREIDWHSDAEDKYYIYFNYNRKRCDIDFINTARDFGQIYFASEKIANKALTAFRDELIWYFTEYCDHIGDGKNENDGGCDLCKSGNLNTVGIINEHICLYGSNSKPKPNEKMQFCPKCGRKLVSENESQ